MNNLLGKGMKLPIQIITEECNVSKEELDSVWKIHNKKIKTPKKMFNMILGTNQTINMNL
jgi:hypothetical protein